MNTELGNIIKTYRKKQSLTQSELAQLCQVSHVAISKWETGKAMPDISLLPILARIFEISIDELLNFQQNPTKEEVDELVAKSLQRFQTHSFKDAFAYTKSLIRMYPNTPSLSLGLAGNFMAVIMTVTPQQADEYITFAIQLCDKLTYHLDPAIVQTACIMLTSLYTAQEQPEKALACLRKSPKLSDTSIIEASLLIQTKQENEATILLEKSILFNLHSTMMAMFSLIKLKANKKQDKEVDQMIAVLEQTEELYHLQSGILDQIYGFYAKQQNKQKTLFYLAKFIDRIVHLQDSAKIQHTSFATVPWFKDIPQGKQKEYPYEQMLMITKEELAKEESLSFLRDDPEFIALLQKLESYEKMSK